MWYMIADANGLTGSSVLKEGTTLTIPNKVANIHNNSQTFRPYNPGEAIGNTAPTLPDPPPPPLDGGCGTIGLIIIIIINCDDLYGGRGGRGSWLRWCGWRNRRGGNHNGNGIYGRSN